MQAKNPQEYSRELKEHSKQVIERAREIMSKTQELRRRLELISPRTAPPGDRPLAFRSGEDVRAERSHDGEQRTGGSRRKGA